MRLEEERREEMEGKGERKMEVEELRWRRREK